MGIQRLLILTACIVNLEIPTVRPHNQVGDQAVTSKLNDEKEIREKFQNLFDSIASNDGKKGEIYHETLKHEVAKERRAFDAIREELRTAQNKNVYKKRNFYEKSHINENIVAIKRETYKDRPSVAPKAAFVAVTSLVGSEDFYTNPRYLFTDDLSPEMKTDICADIIGSPLFDVQLKLDPIDPMDSEIRATLEEHYPDVYADLYEDRDLNVVAFANPYRKREIVVAKGSVRPEFVFSCLAMDRGTGNITRYFVSRVYLLNSDYCRHHKDQTKGVFVFAAQDEGTVVVAMAEQPGYNVQPSDDIPYRFELEVAENTYSGEDDVKKTICALTTEGKIRLCTLVLNAESFRKEVSFVPDRSNIDDRCHRAMIHIPAENDTETIENDWMIGCQGVRRENDETVTYYVSAGFFSYEQIFFCTTERGRGNVTMVGGVGCRIDVRQKAKYPEQKADTDE